MKDSILRNKVVHWLDKEGKKHKTFPQEFTAQEVAGEVEGFAGRIGHISVEVVKELRGRGHMVKYEKKPNGSKFIFAKPSSS